MTRLTFNIAALSAVALAGPALAQAGMTGIETRVDQLQTRLDNGIDAGSITRDEAVPLRDQLRLLRQTERQYGRNGWTSTERRDMQSRIQTTREQIRVAERNEATRYGNSGFIDRNNDGWDDRDANRDGRFDSGSYYGQGGPLEDVPPCPTRNGLENVIGTFLGGQNTNCILQPGQRATSNLYGVPVDMRDEYRDGNGVYYRSDGRAVYQIDARTNIVRRVDPID